MPDFGDFVLLKKLNNSMGNSGSPSRSLSPPPDLSRSKSKSPEAQGLIVKSYSISLKVSDIFSVNEQVREGSPP